MTEAADHARGPSSTTLSIEAILRLALEMADRADAIAIAGFGTEHGVERKGDGSPVTRVDREVESVMRDMIEEATPQAGVLGEEYGEKPGEERWVLDPIDGTVQFIAGDPRFSILIAYEIGGKPVVGVVSAPAMGLRWWAALGHGARLSRDGEVSAARVSVTGTIADARGMLLGGFPQDSDDRSTQVADRLDASGFRAVRGVVSWEAVRVASGEYDFGLTSGAWWDVAPLPVIVAEAGGVVSRIGSRNGRVSLALSNRRISEALGSIL